eukprot:m.335561 g.335561  ORF g.335561 m.335561 type:complete len:415 (-) comp17628_c0_seq1:124-1368(-)
MKKMTFFTLFTMAALIGITTSQHCDKIILRDLEGKYHGSVLDFATMTLGRPSYFNEMGWLLAYDPFQQEWQYQHSGTGAVQLAVNDTAMNPEGIATSWTTFQEESPRQISNVKLQCYQPSTCSAVAIQNFLSNVNGVYKQIPDKIVNSRPVFSAQRSNLYLFFSYKSSRWMVAHDLEGDVGIAFFGSDSSLHPADAHTIGAFDAAGALAKEVKITCTKNDESTPKSLRRTTTTLTVMDAPEPVRLASKRGNTKLRTVITASIPVSLNQPETSQVSTSKRVTSATSPPDLDLTEEGRLETLENLVRLGVSRVVSTELLPITVPTLEKEVQVLKSLQEKTLMQSNDNAESLHLVEKKADSFESSVASMEDTIISMKDTSEAFDERTSALLQSMSSQNAIIVKLQAQMATMSKTLGL